MTHTVECPACGAIVRIGDGDTVCACGHVWLAEEATEMQCDTSNTPCAACSHRDRCEVTPTERAVMSREEEYIPCPDCEYRAECPVPEEDKEPCGEGAGSRCTSCGKPWEVHWGATGLCAQLQAVTAERDALQVAIDSAHAAAKEQKP
jgi:hypothetical protein